MPKTFFLGDHRQMFPHMIEKIILAPESMPIENVRDNVALLNGMDLSPVLENMNIEKVYPCSMQ
jgi:protein O-GlcNAc transferase